MLKYINHQGIEEIINFVNGIQSTLIESTKELTTYVNIMKEKNYDLSDDGVIDDKIKRYENVLDNFDEIMNRRAELNKKGQQLKEMIKTVDQKVTEMMSFIGNKDTMDGIYDEVVLKLMSIEEEIYNEKKSRLETMLRSEVKRELKGIVEKDEMKKLEEWTNMKCQDVLFDSTKDNWNQNMSVFNNKIIGKRNLIFLVTSSKNVKFGSFIHSPITHIGEVKKEQSDTTSFTFSFKNRNFRKYSIRRNASTVMWTYNPSDNLLFGIGSNDFNINKNGKQSVLAQQQKPNATFEYGSEAHPFTGESGNNFIHKRVVVIQMK